MHGSELWSLDITDAPPKTTGLIDVVVQQSASKSIVNLAQAFTGDHDQSSGLLYSIVGNPGDIVKAQ